MSDASVPTSLPLQCPNPECLHPDNRVGQSVCDRCHTPLVYRYLWAVGEAAAQVPGQTLVNDRYAVIESQVWLDTQPARLPQVPAALPPSALPYLHLHPLRLHLPELYGFEVLSQDEPPVLLLDNGPIAASGGLYPQLGLVWETAPAVRQVYWLWQLLQLWMPLKQQGVAISLLIPDNVRVEGWRVRLLELVPDPVNPGSATGEGASIAPFPALKDLAAFWFPWVETAQEPIVDWLKAICYQMQTATDEPSQLKATQTELNRLLLEQAAQLPLKLEVVGATTTGPQRSHNEDACYPDQSQTDLDPGTLFPQVGIICDGIGGHEGGEVASQLAIRSLQLPLRAFLSEFTHQTETTPPEVIQQQLVEVVRVVNNLIAGQNDTQGRELRQRMGTTLVMAIQLPQTVATPEGPRNAHELYLVHVGDSRAYWLTSRYCQLLTLDDDVATRETRMGRSLYGIAANQDHGSALTQALGTREGEGLSPTVQRFILEENGLLLLCSDGLSDRQLVEKTWERSTRQVINGEMSLEDALQQWIDLANQHNGHDNTAVVLFRCQVGGVPKLFDPHEEIASPSGAEAEPVFSEAEWAASSRALLDEEGAPLSQEEPQPVGTAPEASSRWGVTIVMLALVMFTAGVFGMVIWRQVDPLGFQRNLEQWLPPAPPAQSP